VTDGVERIYSAEETRQATAEAHKEGKVVALVPTMGALHEGHLSLVRAAATRAGVVVVSIFVNPTQFGPGEDFERYPRDIDRDLELLAAEGTSVVFTPSVRAMYPPDAQVTVDPGPVGDVLCGADRPGHFRGVATVVAKLLGIVLPDLAFFGEKDFQQLVIVKRTVRDLDMDVRVVSCPIVREPDGLAMSSRNAYLDPAARTAATVLWRALSAARAAVDSGERDGAVLEETMRRVVGEEPLASLDYARVVDPASLDTAASVDGGARGLLAVRFGETRLIDNLDLSA
jgi:pantoate--beta-alanine ligase